ncbi:MAG: 5'-nucleotidase, lipoprotein e(P4) family [Bacteroidales bacterium]
MKKLIIVTGMIILASCGTVRNATVPQAETQDQLILATLWYQQSAEMKALYYQCYRNAGTALEENLKRADKSKPAAVVLDIDETVLDNSPYQGWQVIENKPFNDQDWHRWVDLAQAGPLPGAVEFTRYADSLGVEVFYISNRTVGEMGPTLINLRAYGFADADSTHLLLKETSSSKIERREQLESVYDILVLIGDNLADHSGVYEKRGAGLGFEAVEADRNLFGTRYIILPNPMYGTWLNELMKQGEGATTRDKMVKMLKGF